TWRLTVPVKKRSFLGTQEHHPTQHKARRLLRGPGRVPIGSKKSRRSHRHSALERLWPSTAEPRMSFSTAAISSKARGASWVTLGSGTGPPGPRTHRLHRQLQCLAATLMPRMTNKTADFGC